MVDSPEQETSDVQALQKQNLTVGAKLRAAREEQGLTLQEIASRTRVALRQLEAVERDDYGALPGIPYAVGFSRAYARALGMDEVAIADDVRRAVNASDINANRYEMFEPTDPARVPSRALAWTAAVIAIAVVAGFTLWRTQWLTPQTGDQVAQAQQAPINEAIQPAASAPVEPVAQDVVFTAVDDVWLRISDESGERLKDGLMKKGETFTLPTTAHNPTILTGRPQALSVTVGGKAIPPLGAPDKTISDVPVSSTALLAKLAPAPVAQTDTEQRAAAPIATQASQRPTAPAKTIRAPITQTVVATEPAIASANAPSQSAED